MGKAEARRFSRPCEWDTPIYSGHRWRDIVRPIGMQHSDHKSGGRERRYFWRLEFDVISRRLLLAIFRHNAKYYKSRYRFRDRNMSLNTDDEQYRGSVGIRKGSAHTNVFHKPFHCHRAQKG